MPLGFVLGCENESRGIQNPYYVTPPRPLQNPTPVPNEISGRVVNQLRLKFHPRGEHPCRKIVFTIKSHDQGWADDQSNMGTYKESFTWFDVGLEKMALVNECWSPMYSSYTISDIIQLSIPSIVIADYSYKALMRHRFLHSALQREVLKFLWIQTPGTKHLILVCIPSRLYVPAQPHRKMWIRKSLLISLIIRSCLIAQRCRRIWTAD